MKEHKSTTPLNVWIAKAKAEKVRQTSASGGAFTIVARRMLADGGVVYGAGWNADFTVSHQRVTSIQELEPLRGSKYVQSDLRGIFKHVKEDLISGKKVLFSGTPCQIAGIRAFLGKEYDNLLLVSLICHSITSPDTWKWYLEGVSRTAGSSIKSICFRDKSDGGDGHLMSVRFNDPAKDIVTKLGKNPYALCFFDLLNTRESCFDCQYRSNKSGADIVIGDFWGAKNYHKNFDDGKGVSAIIALTSIGRTIVESLDSIELLESSYEWLVQGNPYLEGSVARNSIGAKWFMSKYRKTDFSSAVRFAQQGPFYVRCYRFVRQGSIHIKCYHFARRIAGAVLRRLRLR